MSVSKIVYKQSMNKSKTFQGPSSHFFSFVSSWLHLRVLEGKAETETAQERLCNGSLPSRKGHSNMELRVINIVLAVQCVEICAVTPKPHIRPHGAMYRISLFCLPSLITHSYRSHMVWDSYNRWIYHSDHSSSFSALCWRKCKNTPIGFDMSVYPSARNNSQPSFHKCLHILANTAVFETNNIRFFQSRNRSRRNATQLITLHVHFLTRYIHSAALNKTTCFAILHQNTHSKWIPHYTIL